MNKHKVGRRVFFRGLCLAALNTAAVFDIRSGPTSNPNSNSGQEPQADPQQSGIDAFFRDFTADWVRHDPDLATRTRYFSGEEQDRFERQLTPLTLAWKRERVELARTGVAQLRKFDRTRLTPAQ